ncbi:MAG: transporter substrate-binding domain-containing protein [Oscillibacter sp.]|nr:transporter substrate-binding domain-containing protein [Oscillibacter sp.]MBP3509961.1 transporter substrate-binding domain-containing protein [Oscillibacter sp.]
MKNMKKIWAMLLALTMILSLAACGSKKETPAPEAEKPAAEQPAETPAAEPAEESDLDYIKGKGSMTIGYTVYAPMNYTDDNGEFTGFDTELAQMVCEKLGVEPNFQEIDWGTKEVELAGKSIDCIWNGMTLDAEREANMNCTQPYVKNAQVVVVKKGTEYTDTSSLIGKTVVAEIGSAGEAQILGGEDAEPDANLAQADYVGKSVQTDCLMEVKAGTATAAVLDMTLANAMIGEGTDYADLEIVDELAIENYGVAFRKGSDVRDAVNAIFDELVADGSLGALAEKYGLELAD